MVSYAIKNDVVEGFDLALELGIDVIKPEHVFASCEHGRLEFLQRLLAVPGLRGQVQDIFESPTRARHPLFLAAKSGNVHMVRYLIREELTELDYRCGRNGDSALAGALDTEESNETIVSILLDAGAGPRILDYEAQVPVVVATRSGNVTVLRLLLETGLEADYRCCARDPTPMTVAQ